MKTYETVTQQVQKLVEIRCDRCGKILEDTIFQGVDVAFTIHRFTDRDAGGEADNYGFDLCNSCVPDVLNAIRRAGVNVRHRELLF
jgi:hypothetical protein